MDVALALVERARSGDRAAFADLHRQFARPVFLYLAGMLTAREDTEDAWQTTFLAAWRHLDRLNRSDRFAPWLFRIARNTARDVAVRRKRWPDRLGETEDLLVAAPDVPSADADLTRAVAGLKPQTRSLVLLRAVEGWSAEDVGAAFSWSVATVRRRYARALDLLRTRLPGSDSHGR